MYILETRCIQTEIQIFPFLENNPVFFEIIFSILTAVLGAITILIGIKNYIKDTQREAQFGFYINLLVLLERIDCLLKEYPQVTEFLFSPEARKKLFGVEMPEERAKIIIPIFTSLCEEFLNYVSTSSNNVPPAKKKSEEWKLWYKNIIMLTDFFQKCKFIGTNLTPYVNSEKKQAYNDELSNVTNAISKIKKQLTQVLQDAEIKK